MKWVERFLMLAALASAIGMIVANPDPLARNFLCDHGFCFRTESAPFWNALIYDIGLGVIVSIIFYWLLVKVPEYRVRRRLRKHLASSYRGFRREITTQALFASNGSRSANYDDILSLAPMIEFRSYFKQASEQVEGDKWHDVGNGITPFIRVDLFAAISLLRDDVSYVLNNTKIDDDKSFELLQALHKSMALALLRPTEPEDDRNLLNLLWQLMAGWDWMDGYPKEDRVQQLIDSI